ncbi:MAG: anthranilate synthase component I [Intestinibacter sp.]
MIELINITKEQFQDLKKGDKIFSYISEFRGDIITPIGIYMALTGKRKFILEGGSMDSIKGRYSFLGEDPYMEVQGNNLEEIDKIKEEVKKDFVSELNPFSYKGGAIGYMGYESIGFYEKKLEFKNKQELNIPIFRFNLYKKYICFDHFKNRIYVVENITKDDDRTYEEIEKEQKDFFYGLLKRYRLDYENEEKTSNVKFDFAYSKEEFESHVEIAKDYIKAGDIFQVVLSNRMYCKTDKSKLEIYRSIREINPSPYMYLLDYEDYQVIGSSPEILVSVKGDKVTTNPIAGTRRRGKDEKEDKLLERDLLNDEKEKAEHIMLVDLGRNDIGKISKIGQVDLQQFMNVEYYSHVMHITSQVVGTLEDGKDCFDALTSCLPAGTVSGAPKIRAMEIIEEIEKVRREVYAGAVGNFSMGGDMDMCIAIRTLILKDSIAYLQAGAGIVYDSVPEKEYEEIKNKLMVLMEALK